MRFPLAVFSFLILLQASLLAEPIRQPPELQPGDEYRLAFVTSTRRDATSTNIADYDAFVQGVADAAPVVGTWGLSWQVIGSTEMVDAKKHTRTDPELYGEGVPIFQLDSSPMAPDYTSLWPPNGLPVFFLINEFGEPITMDPTAEIIVSTGTNMTGTAGLPNGDGRYLGDDRVLTGDPIGGFWFDRSSSRSEVSNHFYAISEVLTAVPEPSGRMMVLPGLLAFTYRRSWGLRFYRRAA